MLYEKTTMPCYYSNIILNLCYTEDIPRHQSSACLVTPHQKALVYESKDWKLNEAITKQHESNKYTILFFKG